METRTIKFSDNSELDIKFSVYVNLTILQSKTGNQYIEITSDSFDKLLLKSKDAFLHIDQIDKPSLGQLIDGVITFVKDKKIDDNLIRLSQYEHIKIDANLYLADSAVVNMKINGGNVQNNAHFKTLHFKGNFTDLLSDCVIPNADIKLNSGNLRIIADNTIEQLDIKINSGNLYIKNTGFTGTINGKYNHQYFNQNNDEKHIILFKINSGGFFIE